MSHSFAPHIRRIKIVRAAHLSSCGRYRYSLDRIWNDGVRQRLLGWVMLNPSTADAIEDDPTIRKCIGFARQWDFDGIVVVNLFGWRAVYPEELKYATDPIGAANDEYILQEAARCSRIIAAWGNWGGLFGRDADVLKLLSPLKFDIECLGRTKAGNPKHPLYAAYGFHPISFLGGNPKVLTAGGI